MTKADLRTGMIVTLANGDEYVVFKDVDSAFTNGTNGFSTTYYADGVLVNAHEKSWFSLTTFRDDLTPVDERDVNWVIVKVERVNHPYSFMEITYDKDERETLWERTKPYKELTVKQIEELLGYPVKIVK